MADISKPLSVENEAGQSPVHFGWDGTLYNPARLGGAKAYTKPVDIGGGDVEQVFVNVEGEARQVTMLLENAYNPEIVSEGIVSFAMESGKIGQVWFADNAPPAQSDNVDGHFQFGQSNCLGTVGGSGYNLQLAGVLLVNAPSDRVLTFVGGIKTGAENDTIAGGDVASWVPAVEQPTAPNNGGYLQLDAGLGNKGFYLVNAQGNRIFVSTTGFGGQAYADIKKGTSQYDNKLLVVVEAAKDLAVAESVDFEVRSFIWIHGESNGTTAAATYQGYLEEIQADFEADAQTITGQTTPIPLFTQQINHMRSGQTTVFGVANGQLLAALANPDKIYLVAPQYTEEFNDVYHFTRESHIFMGSMRAKVIKRVVYEGKPWLPLHPVSAVRTDNRIVVKFHVPVGSLVIDDSLVSNPNTSDNKYGVVFKDSIVSARVQTVKVISPDELEVVLDKTPTGTGMNLGFAYYNATDIPQGRDTGLRTCIRDEDNEGCVVTGRPLHNYCVSSTVTFS